MTQRDFPKYLFVPLVLFGILYGLFVVKEKREGTFTSLGPVKSEPAIYKPDREWIYKGYFFNKDGDIIDSQIVLLKVPGGDFLGQQIKITWNYNKTGAVVTTGVVDTPDRVWIHPPRSGDFRFTELTPFPEIHKPLKEREKWEGTLYIGKGWDEWEGLTVKKYYEIIGQKEVSTLFKDFPECWQINAKTESKKGTYKATFYFHPEYGFVKCEYTKPNGEQVILDLEKVSGFD